MILEWAVEGVVRSAMYSYYEIVSPEGDKLQKVVFSFFAFIFYTNKLSHTFVLHEERIIERHF